MTTPSDQIGPAAEAPVERRPRVRRRFAGAFLLGALVTIALAGAAALAVDASYQGRILPGVRVGGVDLSGLDRQQAATALESSFGADGEGAVVIRTTAGDASVPFREFSRRPDIGAMIDAAMAAGRAAGPVERAFIEQRIALWGLQLEPRIALDAAALESDVTVALARLDREPMDATIGIDALGFVTTRARPGWRFDPSATAAAALAIARRPDAPATVVIDAAPIAVPPARGDAVVVAAEVAALRMVADVVVVDGSRTWTIPAATVRGWVTLNPSAGHVIGPVVDEAAIPAALGAIAKATAVKPVSATYLVGRNGATVGVTASRAGRQLDAAATAAAIAGELAARAGGRAPTPVSVALAPVAPALTTEAARAVAPVAPVMSLLGSWQTWFPIGQSNSWGANIWVPARLINGTVLQPGQTFEWFRAVGPITTARGFGLGGVINGSHTEPTGAIGGGMCSSSTTLFNAALRAGLRMGARANHSYYISRYPLGLDATVTIKGGSVTTMTFTNDMAHAIFIRGIRIVGTGGRGWVRYEIWGVPDGRQVTISKPVVSNVRTATTQTVLVTTLPTGVRKQTEYPSNGMDVAVTRIVRDRVGRILHADTFRSRYRLWNGRIEVGA